MLFRNSFKPLINIIHLFSFLFKHVPCTFQIFAKIHARANYTNQHLEGPRASYHETLSAVHLHPTTHVTITGQTPYKFVRRLCPSLMRWSILPSHSSVPFYIEMVGLRWWCWVSSAINAAYISDGNVFSCSSAVCVLQNFPKK